ncbi:MAG: hypothetical protein M3R04_07170, partial [bacterium]|nr:hypothetical protein [bacterium]
WQSLSSLSRNEGNPTRAISPKWLYQQTLGGAYWLGRPADWVLELMRLSGANTQAQVPWNTNTTFDYDVPASYAAANHLRISSWRRIHCTEQVAIDEIKNQLSCFDHPVLFSFTVNEALRNPAFDATQTFHWDTSAPYVGLAHTVVITGYSDTRQAFHVRNSWGNRWGNQGYFWLGYDNFTSGPAIYGAFVMSTDYSETTAANFNLTQDAAVPPSSVGCVNGVSSIRLLWNATTAATGFRIYRDSLSNEIATLTNGSAGSYTDTTVTDYLAHTYFIRTIVGPSTSIGSAQVRGWRLQPQPPRILSISQRRTGALGTQMRFTPVLNNPDPDAPLTYSWNFPVSSIVESSPRTELRPLVTLNVPGTYQGSLQVNNAGGSQSMYFNFTVFGPGSSPLASFTVPPSVARNVVATFDAGTSTPEQGSKVDRYFWDWNQDGYSDYESSLPILNHIFTQAGTAKLGLKVEDDRGLPSDWSVQTFTVMP